MKKLLSCIFAVTMTLCAYAQPTLTAAAINPVAGQIDSFRIIDSAGITPGPSGAGVVWNFNTAVMTGYETLNYMPCAATPYFDSFTTSNLASYNVYSTSLYNDTTWGYYITDAAKFNNSGFYSLTNGLFTYWKNASILRYPMTFGDNYFDTTFICMAAYGVYTMDGQDSVLADAYGTLILPTGTYTNVLRVKRWHVNGAVSGRNEVYYWFKPGYHTALMSMAIAYNTSGGVDLLEALYYGNITTVTGITNTNCNLIDIKAYPNPATDILNLSFNISDVTGALLTLSDITGRTVITTTDLLQGSNNISIGTTELSAGLYTLRLQTQNGITTQKITIIK